MACIAVAHDPEDVWGDLMAYIEREKIFPNKVFIVNENDPLKSLDELIKRIWSIPAADVVEVCRCENCVSSGGNRFGELICQNQLCPCCGREVDHAFSCIYGERRAE